MKRRPAPSRPDDLIVFLGPSLPEEEALALAPCRVLPPARQVNWNEMEIYDLLHSTILSSLTPGEALGIRRNTDP